ncbi:MAG TPA: polysaccharide biosynthesis protein [Ruminococcaceae bacterium]|nr:polysaccharide biosynthesis protein [Oscillospiraceae bacterium]
MDSSKEIKIGAVLSYLQMGLGVLISLFYTPLMIKTLGQNEYGLYNTVASTISMLSILNLGFNSSYIRYYSKYKKNNDSDGISKLNGLFLLIFIIIGIVAFLCGLFLTENLRLIFDKGLTVSEYKTAKILMFLLTVNLSVSFPMTVFTNIITANEKFVFLKTLLIFKTVFSPFLTIPLLLKGMGSVSIVIVTLVVSVMVDAAYLIYCLTKLRVKFVFRHFEKGLFKDIFVFTSFLAINIVVDQVNLNIDKVLLGRFKGTEIVAIYSVGQTLYVYFQMFSTSVSSLFIPRVHKIVNAYSGQEQKYRLTELFVKVGRIQFLILSLICTGIVFFGKSFIVNYWAGSGYSDAYYVLLLLVIPSMIALTQNIGIEIQRAENNHRFRSLAYLIMASVNFGISIVLCQKYGAIGSAVGTAISLVLANGIIMNIFYQKKCNVDVLVYWRNILKMCLGLFIPVVFGCMILIFVDTAKIINFAVFIIIYIFVYSFSMWFLAMTQNEKQLVIGFVKKCLGR